MIGRKENVCLSCQLDDARNGGPGCSRSQAGTPCASSELPRSRRYSRLSRQQWKRGYPVPCNVRDVAKAGVRGELILITRKVPKRIRSGIRVTLIATSVKIMYSFVATHVRCLFKKSTFRITIPSTWFSLRFSHKGPELCPQRVRFCKAGGSFPSDPQQIGKGPTRCGYYEVQPVEKNISY